MDEQGQRKSKSFSGTSRQEAKEKIIAYIAAFNRQLTASDESKATLEDSMNHWRREGRYSIRYQSRPQSPDERGTLLFKSSICAVNNPVFLPINI